MKKFILEILCIVLILLCISTRGTKEDTQTGFVGLNAEILEINTQLKGFVVKSLDGNSILGEKCYISCESDDIYYIYADNETGETKLLTYYDFWVGDKITVDINTVENKFSLTSRVQLITQRK
ncbi:hypothetical protein DSECCO2_326220 [anaerobic digester metagenome]